MQNNPLNESIESIKRMQAKMEEAAGNTEDVKNGDATKEEEMQEPAYVLFNGIAETSIKILQSPTVVETFDELSKKAGEDLTKKIIETLTIMMTNSAYEAIAFYDSLLKEELTKQFESVGDAFAKIGADVNAHTGALEVFKKRLGELEKSSKINEIKKDIGET